MTNGRIDLGNGSILEITGSELLLSSYPTPKAKSTTAVLNRIYNLAQFLFESRASADQVESTLAGLDPSVLDDSTILTLVARGAELIVTSPERAYYLLRATHALSRQASSFWKHALLCIVVGYVVLRKLGRAGEAQELFREAEVVIGILQHYWGCTEVAQGLLDLSGRGQAECAKQASAGNPTCSATDLGEQVWSALVANSGTGRPEDLDMQAEAFARAVLFISEHPDVMLAGCIEHVLELAENFVSGTRSAGEQLVTESLAPITLCEILATHGANQQALRVLEMVEPNWESAALLARVIWVNRAVPVAMRLGRVDTADQWIARLSPRDLETLWGLAMHSVAAEGELMLYHVARAELCQAQGDAKASKRAAKQAVGQLRALEQWNQIQSCSRRDDLRALHCVILQSNCQGRLAVLGQGHFVRLTRP